MRWERLEDGGGGGPVGGGCSVRGPLTNTKGISSRFKNRWDQKHFALSLHSRSTMPMLMRRSRRRRCDGILLLIFDTSASPSPFISSRFSSFLHSINAFHTFLNPRVHLCICTFPISSRAHVRHAWFIKCLLHHPFLSGSASLTHPPSAESNIYLFVAKLSCCIRVKGLHCCWLHLTLICGEHSRNMKPSPLCSALKPPLCSL